MIERDKIRRDGLVDLTFSLPADIRGPISVVGDFNGWDPYAHPMTPDANGMHTAVVPVPPGTSVCFRYLAHGGIWMDDPEADAYDNRGGIVHVPPAAADGEPAMPAGAAAKTMGAANAADAKQNRKVKA
ncbi:hypothetical protein HNP84_001866 [Thermocatellispora tengchongensis]|uniref:Glycoside hydrolase family 13 N-terminal domain-containing protein n=1 Tax=Thermocatellispora tengchongensis TaxID=1073253 RepID=A0A840P2J8_9ACTN|nr:isoamylase early set domain-containing protein [Thermocatellispora tengchongensis]MBB5132153.1 hypothetical protein [Thermocatellispora tengchongensis]